MKSSPGVESSNLPATSLGTSNEKNEVNALTGKSSFHILPKGSLDSRSTAQQRMLRSHRYHRTGWHKTKYWLHRTLNMSWEGRTHSRRDTWKESSCLKIDTKHECPVTKNSDTTGENVSKLQRNPCIIVWISHPLRQVLHFSRTQLPHWRNERP